MMPQGKYAFTLPHADILYVHTINIKMGATAHSTVHDTMRYTEKSVITFINL